MGGYHPPPPFSLKLKARVAMKIKAFGWVQGWGCFKATLNYLDKPFIFQLRNLSPREAGTCPRSHGQSGGWRVDCPDSQPAVFPPRPMSGMGETHHCSRAHIEFGEIQGSWRSHIDLCVCFYVCHREMILYSHNQPVKTCIRFSKFKF